MKIYKDNTLSIIPRPFGLGGRLYLGVGVAMFFDLGEPDAPLGEQDLWKESPTLLGDMVLDQGMPKQRGEMLLTGACYAPGGEPVRAMEVSARVGALKKSLYIVGDRYWDGKDKIIGPKPYDVMPIDWTRAYGGPDFAGNPSGRGHAPSGGKEAGKQGGEPCPLPNVENPDDPIRHRDQRPEPAGFGPMDPTWPRRMERAGSGTHDDQWLLERWPHVPDDFDWNYFNRAQPDQWCRRGGNGDPFFEPGDPIEIWRMHPEKAVVKSHLPTCRLRLFAITDRDFDPFRFPTSPPSHALKDGDVMREVTTRLETVWLFPDAERAVAIHRGVFEIRDDEFADVTRLFATCEAADEPPKELEYYRDKQAVFLRRMTGVDMSESGDALSGARAALRDVGNLPKKIVAMREAAFGAAPVPPAPGLRDMRDQTASMIADGRAMLDRMEADMIPKLSGLGGAGRARKFIQATRDRLKRNEAEFAENLASLERANAEQAAILEEELGGMGEGDPRRVEEIKSHIAMLRDGHEMKPPSVEPWHDMGFALALSARRVLERDGARREALEAMGLDRETISDKWLGVLESDHRSAPEQWGLDGGEDDCVLPAGLLLPRFDGQKLVALHGVAIAGAGRAGAVKTAPGGIAEGLFYPAASLLEVPGMPARGKTAPALVVEDPFSAVLAEREVGDFCSIVSLENPGQPMDEPAGDALAKAPAVYLLRGADRRGEDATPWRNVFPVIATLCFERAETIFDAHRVGESLRDRMLKALPSECFPKHALDTTLPAPGEPPDETFMQGFEPPDIKTINDKLREDLLNHHIAETEALLNGHPQFRETIGRSGGIDLRAMLAEHENLDADETMAMVMSFAQKGLAMLDGAKPGNAETLKPMMEENIARLLAAKETIKKTMEGDIPADMKKQFAQSGIDVEAMRKRDREEVLRMRARGQTLSGAILDGVDLSGQDLSGVDFTRCGLQGTNFGNAILDGCLFDSTRCDEAIFENASMKGATFKNGVFDKPVMTGADLTGATMEKFLLSNADCKNAVFDEAVLTLSQCAKCDMAGARFERFKSHLAMFGDTVLDEADFSEAEMTKTVFNRSSMRRARFVAAVLRDTMFDGVEGEDVDFDRADLDTMRAMGNTILQRARFTHARMRRVSLRNSDFGGAVFAGAVLDDSIIQSCQLVGAKLAGVSARGARFDKTNLDAADMRGINLHGGSLKNAKVTRTDLGHSHLYNAQLHKMVTGDTKLDGADYRNTMLHKAEQTRKSAEKKGETS